MSTQGIVARVLFTAMVGLALLAAHALAAVAVVLVLRVVFNAWGMT